MPDRLGLAVSGGPDSLALLLLAHHALPGRICGATVDHGLRQEAADEARFVNTVCQAIDVLHDVLRPARPITGNIQSAARRARYAQLESWRVDRGLDFIATAHHADDQVETVLMRLNRGSGVGGLAGVRLLNRHVVRPLLGWRRAELERLVHSAGLNPVSDPSNEDERFDRARLRRQLAQADFIDADGFVRSAAALAEADAALDWSVGRLIEERVRKDGEAFGIDAEGLPAELRRRLVRRLLLTLNPQAELRGEQLGRFIASLDAGATTTLAGVKGKGGSVWRLEAAPPRRPASRRLP